MSRWVERFSHEETQTANTYREKTFNIFSHQRNANQHHIGILSHPSQKGYNQRNKTATNVGKDGGGKSTHSLMLGMRTKAATEVSVENLYNTTNTVTTWSSYGGLNEMAPGNSRHLNAWSSRGGWKELGGMMVLLEEVHPWGQALKFQETRTISS